MLCNRFGISPQSSDVSCCCWGASCSVGAIEVSSLDLQKTIGVLALAAPLKPGGLELRESRRRARNEAESTSTCDPGVEAHELLAANERAVDEVVIEVQAAGVETLSQLGSTLTALVKLDKGALTNHKQSGARNPEPYPFEECS